MWLLYLCSLLTQYCLRVLFIGLTVPQASPHTQDNAGKEKFTQKNFTQKSVVVCATPHIVSVLPIDSILNKPHQLLTNEFYMGDCQWKQPLRCPQF